MVNENCPKAGDFITYRSPEGFKCNGKVSEFVVPDIVSIEVNDIPYGWPFIFSNTITTKIENIHHLKNGKKRTTLTCDGCGRFTTVQRWEMLDDTYKASYSNIGCFCHSCFAEGDIEDIEFRTHEGYTWHFIPKPVSSEGKSSANPDIPIPKANGLSAPISITEVSSREEKIEFLQNEFNLSFAEADRLYRELVEHSSQHTHFAISSFAEKQMKIARKRGLSKQDARDLQSRTHRRLNRLHGIIKPGCDGCKSDDCDSCSYFDVDFDEDC